MSKIILPLRRKYEVVPSFYSFSESQTDIGTTIISDQLPSYVAESTSGLVLYDADRNMLISDGGITYIDKTDKNFKIRNEGTADFDFVLFLQDTAGKFEISGFVDSEQIIASLSPGEIYSFSVLSLSVVAPISSGNPRIVIQSEDGVESGVFTCYLRNIQEGDAADASPDRPPLPNNFSLGDTSVFTNSVSGLVKRSWSSQNISVYFSDNGYYNALLSPDGLQATYNPKSDGVYKFDSFSFVDSTYYLWIWSNDFFYFKLYFLSDSEDIWIGRIYCKNLDNVIRENQEFVPLYEGYMCQSSGYEASGKVRLYDCSIDPEQTGSKIKKAISSNIELKNISVSGSYTYNGSIKGTMILPGYPLTCDGYIASVSFYAK